MPTCRGSHVCSCSCQRWNETLCRSVWLSFAAFGANTLLVKTCRLGSKNCLDTSALPAPDSSCPDSLACLVLLGLPYT